jgi:transcriptional regulator with XRE-family HTH domain
MNMTSTEVVSTKARHLRHLLLVAIGQEEIGRRIAQARVEAQLTQADLADKIGVATAQSISRYERGETEVSGKRLRRIADATGKPLSYFVQEPEEVVPPDRLSELQATVERNQALLEQALRLLDDLAQAQRSGSAPPADVQELA